MSTPIVTGSRVALAIAVAMLSLAAVAEGLGADGTWNLNGNGNWDNSVTAPWLGGIVAGGIDSTTTFDAGAAIGGIRTITLSAPRTVGHLIFNDRDNSDVNYWNIASNINALTLQTSSGTPTITLYGTTSASASQKDARISAVLAGDQGFTFQYIANGGTASPSPRFELYGNNTYTGITDITGGVVQTGHVNGLGAGGSLANRTIVRSGARLHLETGSGTYNEIIQLDGGTLSDPVNHAQTLGGLVYLTASSVINKQGSNTMTFNPAAGNAIELNGHNLTFTGAANAATTLSINVLGAITGTGGITLANTKTGVVAFAGQNTYTGGTTLNGGVLRLAAAENPGVSGPLGASGTISFGGGALQYSAANQYDYSGRFNTAAGQVYRIDLGGQNVTWSAGLTSASTLILGGAGGTQFPNTLTLAGNYSLSTITLGSNGFPSGDNTGSLRILSGLTATGTLNFSDNVSAHGHLRVSGGELRATTTNFGTIGGVSQRALVLRQDAGKISAGTINTNEGRPLLSIAGGEFNFTTLNLNATGGASGVFDISDGTVTGGQANIGQANARRGLLTVRGGSFTATGMTLGVNQPQTHGTFGTLVVSDTGVVDLGTAALTIGGGGNVAAPGVGTVNLVGGTLKTGAFARTGQAATSAHLTFSGGTLQATQNSATFLQGLTSANIYVGGATIDTQGFDVTIAQPLLGNTGQGVLTIPVLSGGIGYMAPPTLTISGGGGTGATAVANLNQFGVVESITVTNPGRDYTGPISVAVADAGTFGSGLTVGEATFGDNATGGLTKLGSGTLTLSGVNTYTGPTHIADGVLALSNTGSILDSSGIDIAAGAQLDTTAQSFAMQSTQPIMFEIDPTDFGVAGLIEASMLDITDGVIAFNVLDELDDPFYILANYDSLVGTLFASIALPDGYAIDYNYLDSNQIALVQNAPVPEPATLLLWALGFGIFYLTRRRRR